VKTPPKIPTLEGLHLAVRTRAGGLQKLDLGAEVASTLRRTVFDLPLPAGGAGELIDRDGTIVLEQRFERLASQLDQLYVADLEIEALYVAEPAPEK